MKILQINTERTWRGGERQTLFTAEAMRDRGHWSGLIVRDGCPLHHKAEEAGLQTFPIKPLGPWDIFSAWKIRKLVQQHKIDLIHSQTSHALNLVSLVKMPIPVVASRRVDFPVKNSGKYNCCAAIIAISNAIRQILLESKVNGDLISVIPSGVDVTIDADTDVESIRRSFWQEDCFLVGSVGHLANHKAFDVLLEAWVAVVKALPFARLLIVGEGEERPGLEKLIAEAGTTDSVALAGFQNNPGDFISAFDLYVQPSRTEGLGSTVIDAMLRGTPVLVSDAGGLPEVVAGGKYGSVVPREDPAALASALISLIKENSWNHLEQARQWAMERFSIDRMAEETLGLYQQVVEK